MAYDDQNIFARILRGEIPAKKVYEDDHVLAFHDIAELAPVHVLVIPKGSYETLDDFTAGASDAELAAVLRAAAKIAKELGVTESGYRIVANNGPDAGQEVPHFHMHVLGGRRLSALARQTGR
jgi:diadenosine tetraphosphate (Ap4A) HIT family hydrolase